MHSVLVFLWLAPWTAGAAPAPPPESACDDAAARILGQRDLPPAEAEKQLEGAYARCQEGHGISSALALLALGRHDTEKAIALLRRELLAAHPSPRAFMLAADLVGRLEPPLRAQLLEVGSRKELTLHLEGILQLDDWFSTVECPDGVRGLHKIGQEGSAVHQQVTCADGATHDVWNITDSTLDSDLPKTEVSGQTPFVSEVLPKLVKRFGVTSAMELRASAAAISADRADRSDAWMLSWIRDLPTQREIWQALLQRDPLDMEARSELASDLERLGDVRGALEVLQGIDVDRLQLRDTRGSNTMQASTLLTQRCQLLWKLKRPDEAHKACLDSLAHGSRQGANEMLARMEYLEGQLPEAEAHVETALANPVSTKLRPRILTLHAMILRGLKRDAQAEQELQEALQKDPSYTPAHLARAGALSSAKAWVQAMLQHEVRAESAMLADCGHYYLELGLPQRAERCFVASESLVKGPALAARWNHDAERDPQAALVTARRAVAAGELSPEALLAWAQLERRTSHVSEAQAAAARAIAADPGQVKARELLDDLCKQHPAQACAGLRTP